MTLRNTLIATAIAALGASAWAQAPTGTDPLKKPAAPALGAPASPSTTPAAPAATPAPRAPGTPMATSGNKATEKAMPKHEKHASKVTHKKHAKKVHPKQDMHKASPEQAHSS